ncbi:MAG: hypothetical protein CVV27_01475 [Candidatus Melainabacteria bacterium HGW-Melainabacteria-1]|nr:MAG: hypothetical protein CVV27_01475 [Candidatus Melainabacteria bacterium HGW-Melainabacteria-1]
MQIRLRQDPPCSLPELKPSAQTPPPGDPVAGPHPATPDPSNPPSTAQDAKPDSSQVTSKSGNAMPVMSLLPDPPPTSDPTKPGAKPDPKPFKLTSVDVGASILNDSNLFVKDEDDLGMTTSYAAHANLSFLNRNGSQTDVSFNNRSALHSQFLARENDLTHQSTLTTNEFEVGIRNNDWLLNNPHFSAGAKLQYKGVDTNPASGWANVQAGLHDLGNLRQYQNHENPFVGDQAYLTPMLTLDFEDENIKGHLYLKTEAKTGFGTMIPMQQNRDFQTALRADAYGSVKFGYAYRDRPLIYLKMDGNISNDPLPYNRDHGTLGAMGLAIGNEFSLMKRKNMDLNLFLETRLLQPYGNLPNNPLPNQTGKHDLIHEMFNLKLQIKLK